MSRERRQALAHVLPVADVREDTVHERHARTRLCGDVQARTRQQRRESQGLEGHGLAARVGPRDDEDVPVLPESQIVRNCLLERQQRMSQLVEVEHAVPLDPGLDGPHLARELSAREGQIDPGQGREIRAQHWNLRRNPLAELAQHPLQLASDAELRSF